MDTPYNLAERNSGQISAVYSVSCLSRSLYVGRGSLTALAVAYSAAMRFLLRDDRYPLQFAPRDLRPQYGPRTTIPDTSMPKPRRDTPTGIPNNP